MASRGSFFALSGNQANSQPFTVTEGGTYQATGPGLYWIDRSPSTDLSFVLPDDPGSFAFTLVLYIKDRVGDADVHPITITDPVGYLIDGETSLVLNTAYAAATLVFDGNGWSQVA